MLLLPMMLLLLSEVVCGDMLLLPMLPLLSEVVCGDMLLLPMLCCWHISECMQCGISSSKLNKMLHTMLMLLKLML